MPVRPQRPCRASGCRALHRNANGYCDAHAEQAKSHVREKPRETSSARGYGYKWQQARAGFLAKHPLCVHCQARGRITAATDVDHVEPHKGDMTLFWDRTNWQALCAPCHSTKTAAEDGGFGNGRRGAYRLDILLQTTIISIYSNGFNDIENHYHFVG